MAEVQTLQLGIEMEKVSFNVTREKLEKEYKICARIHIVAGVSNHYGK